MCRLPAALAYVCNNCLIAPTAAGPVPTAAAAHAVSHQVDDSNFILIERLLRGALDARRQIDAPPAETQGEQDDTSSGIDYIR
jgi:hypothetical protein